jgi:hypothetical protein
VQVEGKFSMPNTVSGVEFNSFLFGGYERYPPEDPSTVVRTSSSLTVLSGRCVLPKTHAHALRDQSQICFGGCTLTMSGWTRRLVRLSSAHGQTAHRSF